jgi:hypothetical protein
MQKQPGRDLALPERGDGVNSHPVQLGALGQGDGKIDGRVIEAETEEDVATDGGAGRADRPLA